MSHREALSNWLDTLKLEADIPSYGGQPDPGIGGPPMGDPTGMGAAPPADAMAGKTQNDPNVANMPNQMAPGQEGGEDITQDPQSPDMPADTGEEDEDFEDDELDDEEES